MTRLDRLEEVAGRRLIQCRIWFVAAGALILFGAAPLVYLTWDGSRNYLPLSMPLTLSRGQYTSPWFTPSVNDTWQVDLEWPRAISGSQVDPERPYASIRPIKLSIDWKIVDQQGSLIAQGIFADGLSGGNEVHLGSYTARRGIRQHILLDVHDDVPGDNDAHPTLKIEDPEPSLDVSYGFPVALGWAAIFGCSGLLVLIIGVFRRAA